MEEEPIRPAAKRDREALDAYWVPTMGVDYWDDLDAEMGSEFASAEEAVMAFKQYAKLRMFEPVMRSPSCLGCRWNGCAFSVQFDGPELREVLPDLSHFSHEHLQGQGQQQQLTKRKKKKQSGAALCMASYATFSIATASVSTEDPWQMRAKWLNYAGNDAYKVPGMGGDAGPAYASSQKYFVDKDIPGFPWTVAKKHVAKLERFRRAHFEKGAQYLYGVQTVVIRTETLSLEEMTLDMSEGDANYLRWWVQSTPSAELCFLRVVGASAFALQRTFMLLQYAHGVFDRLGSGAPFAHTEDYRLGGGVREKGGRVDGAMRHAIFVPQDESKVETQCLLAIDACALASIRLESLVYVPIHMRMPAAPVLLQAWSRVGSEPELRLHGMSATLHFFAQHLTRVHTRNNRWIHPISSPAFAIYDMLPEFLELLRCSNDSHLLSLLRESILDGAHASNRDSTLQCILGFVLQRQEHLISRRMNDKLQTLFARSHDLRHAHPIAAALLQYYRDHPTPMRSNYVNQRVDFYLPSWSVLKLDRIYEKYRPQVHVSECKPHHFFYMLCFDNEHFSEHMRADIALSFAIDNYDSRTEKNDLHQPSFNMSKKILTADQAYFAEFRNYMQTCANSGSGEEGPPTTFFSNDLRDALPLRCLYLTMATIQHLSWNPPQPYSAVEGNPNRAHANIPPSSINPRLNSDNVISVVRVGDVVPIVTGHTTYDMPVARTSHFVPSAEVRAMRPFPRRPAIYHNAKKLARVETYLPSKSNEEVLYMSEFLLAFPLKKQASQADPTIAQLDAFLLVRDPAYLTVFCQQQQQQERRRRSK